jgi:hypothetical protein
VVPPTSAAIAVRSIRNPMCTSVHNDTGTVDVKSHTSRECLYVTHGPGNLVETAH